MKSKLISQGAEAKIFLSGDSIVKDRIKKSYRHPELDKQIRKRRTKAETKLLLKASEIINTPRPEVSNEEYKIKMPSIKGEKLSENLNNLNLKKQKQICKNIGESVAKLHNKDLIHGDLTTSNMILVEDKVFFIDFGLGYISKKYEDKAVDVHLFKQALEAKHFKNWEILFEEFVNGYESVNKKEAEKVLNQMKKVEKRGRYRS